MSRDRIVCLVGPTASGKTTLALRVAERWPVEIVSADSRQVYRGLDIGTAKPTAAEQARVRHHGLDLIDPGEEYDAGRFAEMARTAITAAHGREHDILVVGGTGLYVRSLLRGLSPVPPRSLPLRRVLMEQSRHEGMPALHRWLRAIDPAIAARVHPNDGSRIVRALEVAFDTGRRLSEWQQTRAAPAPWHAWIVGLDVPVTELDARIAARVQTMMASGWLAEVERLVRATPPDAPAWRTVGYRELRALVDGSCPHADAVAAITRATRQFAKRQRTWFRHQADVTWLAPTPDGNNTVIEAIVAFLRGPAAPSGPHPH